MAIEQNLILYVKPFCPFCEKVERFMQENGIEIEERNVFEPENRADLLRIGGKDQAPCLIIDGKPLYESDDIIVWLKEHLVA